MEEDGSWVFDSLVCFLNGPIWNAPLQSFIEEKSLIFEPNIPENEEYQKIFDEFKNLVDFMLGNFMEDIGISPEQFENACKEGKRYQVSFDHNLFEQIWAANDYEMFKRMMTQRNVELQLQALELIEQKYGITPQSFTLKTAEDYVRETPVMVEKTSDFENEVLDEVKKTFPDEEPSTSEHEVKSILEEKEQLEKTLLETKENIIVSAAEDKGEFSQKPPDIKIEEPIKNEQKLPEQPVNSIAEELVMPVIENHDNKKKSNEVDAIELKKRQEYLRAQRDKLVALKKEVRRKQLDVENGPTVKTRSRPRSAKAAESVMAGEKPNLEPQQLLIRKTLAERLRSEVVGKETK